MSRLLLDRPPFDSGVVGQAPISAESIAMSASRQDENALLVATDHCASKMDNKTRLIVPPQAPVLSFIAQEHLNYLK